MLAVSQEHGALEKISSTQRLRAVLWYYDGLQGRKAAPLNSGNSALDNTAGAGHSAGPRRNQPVVSRLRSPQPGRTNTELALVLLLLWNSLGGTKNTGEKNQEWATDTCAEGWGLLWKSVLLLSAKYQDKTTPAWTEEQGKAAQEVKKQRR